MNDATSNQRLTQVNPLVAGKVELAANLLASEGTYFRVAQGLRTYAEQNALYAQGRATPGHIVTNAVGGYSNHNFGLAVDCYPFLSGTAGEVNFSVDTPQFQAMVRALKTQGLKWAGDWIKKGDNGHFYIGPANPTDADRAAFAKGGLQAVWALYAETAA
ncbi:M15 family metallopeptidase [Silvimonas sp.]|uniref:M15 family metallopeptidase n=1 Tax=Silvimonas sp. TaxID=2650811 RepID=UPI002841E59D|nr:M15 family metallopeptidase [Silvimonas sp.]MDR3426096.1 M15 family metallopeptidase [Silvimonas sp.]